MHPRLQAAPTLAARTHACSPHPRVQPAPTLAGSTHACCHHARLQPAPNACRRDFARQRTSISPRCPAFFLSLDSLPVQPAECVKGSSSLANALFPDSLGIQRLFPVQALFLRPPHLFLLWLSRSRCPAPHVCYKGTRPCKKKDISRSRSSGARPCSQRSSSPSFAR